MTSSTTINNKNNGLYSRHATPYGWAISCCALVSLTFTTTGYTDDDDDIIIAQGPIFPPVIAPKRPALWDKLSGNKLYTQLDTLTINGNISIPPAILKPLTAPYIGKYLTHADLKAMSRAIQSAYKAKGLPSPDIRVPLHLATPHSLTLIIEEAALPTTSSNVFPFYNKSFILDKVMLQGVQQLKQTDADAVTAPYSGQPFSIQLAFKLMRELKRLYAENHLPVPHIAIPLSTFGLDSTITLNITEGVPGRDTPRIQRGKTLAERVELVKSLTYTPDLNVGEASLNTTTALSSSPSPLDQALQKLLGPDIIFTPQPRPAYQLALPQTEEPQTLADKVAQIGKTLRLHRPEKPKPAPTYTRKPKARGTTPTLTKPHTLKEAEEVLSTVPFTMAESLPAVETPYFGDTDYSDLPEDNLLILEVVVGQTPRVDAIFAFIDEATTYIPLGAITQAMGLPIIIDPSTGTAKGWMYDEDNTLVLDTTMRFLELNGERQTYPDRAIRRYKSDIYIARPLLEAWLQAKLDTNFNELRLYISPERQLPFQIYEKRRENWEELIKRRNKQRNRDDAINLAPRLFSLPTINLNTGHSYVGTADGESYQTSTASVQSQFDFLGFSTSLSANARHSQEDGSSLNNIRFNMRKTDPNAHLLGPLQASNLEIGDVNLPAQPLLAGRQRGRGVRIDNTINNFEDPENITIVGNATPGWDVEIYQDNILIDFQVVPEDGEYRFEALDLSQGYNTFNIILYGPNGEREERVETYTLGQNMPKPGHVNYSAVAAESSKELFVTDSNSPASAAESSLLSLRTEYGITRNLSVGAGLYRGIIGDKKGEAITIGLRNAFNRIYNSVDAMKQSDGGSAVSAHTQIRIGKNLNLSAGHRRYANMDPTQQTLTQTTTLGFYNQLNLKGLPKIGYSLDFEGNKYLDQASQNNITGRISTNVGRTSLTNETVHRSYPDSDSDANVSGQILAARNLLGTQLRTRLGYEVKPITEFTDLEISGSRPVGENTVVRGTVNQNLSSNQQTRASLGINRTFENLTMGLDVATSTDGDISAGIRVGTTLVPGHSDNGGYGLEGKTSSINAARIPVRVFIDTNNNNRFDATEATLEGITIINRDRATTATTNKNGIATLSGVTPYTPTALEIDVETLPSIYMQPAKTELLVSPQGGLSEVVNFPVITLGEINGYVAIRRNGKLETLKNIPVKLMESGQVVQTYTSEYDGFFLFESLPLGTYHILIEDADAQAIGASVGANTNVELKNTPIQNNQDLILEAVPGAILLETEENTINLEDAIQDITE